MKRFLVPGIMALGMCAALSVATVDEAAARQVAGNTRTSVNHNANVNRNTNANVNRNTNVNANRNVNVNTNRHVDVDVDVDRHYHPVATAAVATAAVATTAAVVGSIVRTLPPSCSQVNMGGVVYQQCGGVYYQPQYVGTQVQYVVVNP
ncbi:hypothetical protein QTI66_00505 [Variovorax sp. J22R133]|nr:hypothetical protein [Variovorax sp. J22R133]MDM0110605.1 hypothetical protein [Variovorax sp. J22R133]